LFSALSHLRIIPVHSIIISTARFPPACCRVAQTVSGPPAVCSHPPVQSNFFSALLAQPQPPRRTPPLTRLILHPPFFYHHTAVTLINTSRPSKPRMNHSALPPIPPRSGSALAPSPAPALSNTLDSSGTSHAPDTHQTIALVCRFLHLQEWPVLSLRSVLPVLHSN